MSLSFPSTPVLNQQVTISGESYVYNGAAWKKDSAADTLKTINGQSLLGGGNFNFPAANLTLSQVDKVVGGDLVSGQWFRASTISRLLMSGTGTVVVDAKNSQDVISTSVYTKTLVSAVGVSDFLYAGDDAQYIRATFPQTVSVTLIP